MSNPVSAVSKAISSVFNVVGQWMKGANARRNRAFKKAAWDYVETVERKDIKETSRKQYLRHYKKRMKAYN
jgi:hypothetical protein